MLKLVSLLTIFGCVLEILATSNDAGNLLKVMKMEKNVALEFYENIRNIEGAQEIDAECLSHLEAIEHGLGTKDIWSIQIVDAWGKLPSGLLYKHLVELGNFDECRDVTHAIETYNINGKYCLADIFMGQIFNTLDKPKLQIGICIPAACKAEQLSKPLEQILARIYNLTATVTNTNSVKLKDKSCLTAKNPSFEPIDWVAMGVLALIMLLMIISTVYDFLTTHNGESLHPLWGSFSVRSNMRQLLHISTNVNTPHFIHCLNGMRCISMIWIVFLHTNMRLARDPNINNIELESWTSSLMSSFNGGGSMAVDTFFFLSGLLVIMVSFREMEKNSGRINVVKMYLHRFLRLTPVMYLTLLVCMSLTRYISPGPLRTTMNRSCKDTWWATLLYVQNYAVPERLCFGHSWYLAVDMQLYIISPLVLIAIWKWKRKAMAGVFVIGLLLMACLFSMIVIKEIDVLKIFSLVGNNKSEMSQIYYATHTRATPWLVGIAVGYYLYCRAGRRVKLTKSTVVMGWIIALAFLFITLFALLPSKQVEGTLSPLEGAVYLSLTRVAWPLALAWIVFACVNGYGGPANQFLSCYLWQPMSKLCYCLYICHLEVVYINAGRLKTNSYLSDYDGILRFWSNFGISLLVALVMYLAIESPMLIIDKFVFSKKKEKPNMNGSVKTVMVSQKKLCDT